MIITTIFCIGFFHSRLIHEDWPLFVFFGEVTVSKYELIFLSCESLFATMACTNLVSSTENWSQMGYFLLTQADLIKLLII